MHAFLLPGDGTCVKGEVENLGYNKELPSSFNWWLEQALAHQYPEAAKPPPPQDCLRVGLVFADGHKPPPNVFVHLLLGLDPPVIGTAYIARRSHFEGQPMRVTAVADGREPFQRADDAVRKFCLCEEK